MLGLIVTLVKKIRSLIYDLEKAGSMCASRRSGYAHSTTCIYNEL